MKKENVLQRFMCFLTKSILAFGLIIFLTFGLYAQSGNRTDFKVKPEDILASCHPNASWQAFQLVAVDFTAERGRLITELLEILKNPQSTNFDQCAAAYYLGEMRAPEAADVLATKITLKLDFKHISIDGLPVMPIDFPTEALIKIGNPSIPAVIRNLAESDDAKVRELSLKVLYRIDGDKDIVQLRLQKVLNAEKDLQKQARLQLALKALGETSFEN
jgi:HEAT repeat protein